MKNKFKLFLNNLRRFVEIPFCASCQTRLSPISQSYVCFCNDCTAKWYMAKSKMCPKCSETAEKCVCTPKFFKKHQDYIPSLIFYSSKSGNVPSNTLLTLKYRKNGELFKFLAFELAPKIKTVLSERNISPKDCIITWMPRQKKNILKFGFDHSEKLVRCLAKELGAQPLPMFRRKSGIEQKKLDTEQRRQNAEDSVILRKSSKFGGKRVIIKEVTTGKNVIIIDDIITTGATLRRGVLLALPLKPKSIICATVAKNMQN